MTTKNSKVNLPPQEEVQQEAEQQAAQVAMSAQKQADEILRIAREQADAMVQDAARLKEEAALRMASIAKENKTIDADIRQMDKLTLDKRMDKLFGEDSKRIAVAVPLGEDKEATLTVRINGYSFPFKRGEAYNVPEALATHILGQFKA